MRREKESRTVSITERAVRGVSFKEDQVRE